MKVVHVLRKPCSESTVAANVLRYGTGALNIDATRIGYEHTPNPATNPLFRKVAGYKNTHASDTNSSSYSLKDGDGERNPNAGGRWPANLVLQHLDGCVQDGTETVAAWTCAPGCPVAALDAQSGVLSPQGSPKRVDTRDSSFLGTGFGGGVTTFYGDTGGASRFFKQVKP